MAPVETERLWRELYAIRARLELVERDSQRTSKKLDVLEKDVAAMREADAIAEGVALRLTDNVQARDSHWQRVAVRVGIAGAIVAGLGELVAIAARIFA